MHTFILILHCKIDSFINFPHLALTNVANCIIHLLIHLISILMIKKKAVATSKFFKVTTVLIIYID